VIAALLAALLAAGPVADAAPDPEALVTAQEGSPQSEDAAMLRDLEIIEKLELLEHLELFGADER